MLYLHSVLILSFWGPKPNRTEPKKVGTETGPDLTEPKFIFENRNRTDPKTIFLKPNRTEPNIFCKGRNRTGPEKPN